jgi:hypothetical protein
MSPSFSSSQDQLADAHVRPARRRLHRGAGVRPERSLRHPVQLLPERVQEQERLLPPPLGAPLQVGAGPGAAPEPPVQLPAQGPIL